MRCVLLSFPFHQGKKGRYREVMTDLRIVTQLGSGRAGMWTWLQSPYTVSRAWKVWTLWVGRVRSLKFWIEYLKFLHRNFPPLLEGWCFLHLRFSLFSPLNICQKNLEVRAASLYSPNIHWIVSMHGAVQNENGRLVLDSPGKMHIIMLSNRRR